MTDFSPDPKDLKPGCAYPDCPSRWVTSELVKDLKVIQSKQDDQKALQQKMVEHQVENGKMQSDVRHMNDNIVKIDARITDAFRAMEKKADKDDVIAKETLVTKGDVGKLLAFTSGLITILFVIIEFVRKMWGF